MPLTVTMITRDLFQTLTKKASTERHLLDILAACQLFSILYAIIVHVMPLENQFMEKPSNDIARDLNVVHWINLHDVCFITKRFIKNNFSRNRNILT